MNPRLRRRDERGSAVVELVWLGILLLIPLVYVLLSVFRVQAGSFAADTAARSAARAYALAPDDASGQRAADAAVQLAFADQGLEEIPVRVRVTCQPYPDQCHAGTSVITVRITSQVGLPLAPAVFGGDRPSVRVEASHTVPIGQYQETP